MSDIYELADRAFSNEHDSNEALKILRACLNDPNSGYYFNSDRKESDIDTRIEEIDSILHDICDRYATLVEERQKLMSAIFREIIQKRE